MLIKISLVPHSMQYAKVMSLLSSAPEIKDVLGLTDEQYSVEGTTEYIDFIMKEEKLGKQYSRIILDEYQNFIGVITLKDIQDFNKSSHLTSWIGHQYLGRKFNAAATSEILYIAFTELNLEYVFAGAELSNLRLRKSQEKLPYMRIGVQSEFPEEHKKLESQASSPCILNVVESEDFLNWSLKNY